MLIYIILSSLFVRPNGLHVRSNLVPGLTYDRLIGNSYLQAWLHNPNHLLLMSNALFMNTNVICVMQVMWAIHAHTYFRALMNISILSLVNRTI